MLTVSHGPGGALSGRRSPPLKFSNQKPKKPLPFSTTTSSLHHNNCNTHFFSLPPTRRTHRHPLHPTFSKPDSSSWTDPDTSTTSSSSTVFVGEENVPLEGVIQFDKPTSSFSSQLDKWGRIGLLAGGDVLALLLFGAIGRYSHGFSVFDAETLRTADPFIAGWFLGAYFLGGYGEDGRGLNGRTNALIAAGKSWFIGIPLGLIIRAATSGHIPPYTFILVTIGTTGVLLIAWRALSYNILPKNEIKKDDMYRRGNPFELFELLTSLIRRW